MARQERYTEVLPGDEFRGIVKTITKGFVVRTSTSHEDTRSEVEIPPRHDSADKYLKVPGVYSVQPVSRFTAVGNIGGTMVPLVSREVDQGGTIYLGGTRLEIDDVLEEQGQEWINQGKEQGVANVVRTEGGLLRYLRPGDRILPRPIQDSTS